MYSGALVCVAIRSRRTGQGSEGKSVRCGYTGSSRKAIASVGAVRVLLTYAPGVSPHREVRSRLLVVPSARFLFIFSLLLIWFFFFFGIPIYLSNFFL